MSMSTDNHPIEQEELMAYLDGELATTRALEAAEHLERCAECQEFAAEMRKISQELAGWEVEAREPEEGMPIAVQAALQDRTGKPRKNRERLGWRILLTPRGLAWAGAGTVVAALFLTTFSVSRLRPAKPSAPQLEQKGATGQLVELAPPHESPGYQDFATSSNGSGTSGKSVRQSQSAGDEIGGVDHTGVPELPMIARTAALTLVAKDFDRSRASVEEILKRHNGYVGELNVSAPAEAGRTLTATLRIPAPQLEAALAELKALGRVENESQGGEEVTAQYVDLEARLKNAQHTEQRLTEILRSRTGKLQDVLKVELEIDRVRGEIEQMQAEKKELTKRVAFATLNTTVKEEYQAKLQGAPPSTGSRFRNAAVDGYNTVVEGLIDVGLFLLSSGPALLIWVAILFFPVRWLWRKVRAELKKNHEQA